MFEPIAIRRVGNSMGLLLSKEILAKLDAQEGTELYIRETPNGIELSPYDDSFAKDMEIGQDIARRYRNALHKLAE